MDRADGQHIARVLPGVGPRRAPLWLLAAVLAAPLSGLASQPAAAPAADSAPAESSGAAVRTTPAPRSARQAAAMRGVDYFIELGDSMPPNWRASIFATLYRIVPDERYAKRILSILDAVEAEPMAELPTDLTSPTLLRAARLRPVLLELWRRKQTGGEWEKQVATLRTLVGKHEQDLWSSMRLTQQLVFMHSLNRLGIQTQRTSRDVARELRERWSGEPQGKLLLDRHFMFAVTHIFYVDSEYHQKRLDPAGYAGEIEILNRALHRYVRAFPSDRIFIDIAAEVLVSRRLLGLPQTATSRVLTRMLLERQNANGSWGTSKGFSAYHSTTTVVEALIDYPAEFRTRR